ncbi:unnamed protein product [Linum tenue]|uniref:Uncharacterized protein n=1 Tax=Linum tenue TaxID=586396 RepID=A0AAV0JTL0_9ROSI|nr:unnamed protein product [Linum tenue]CAI0412579.1 unnamed protein product [Linum tenue]
MLDPERAEVSDTEDRFLPAGAKKETETLQLLFVAEKAHSVLRPA